MQLRIESDGTVEGTKVLTKDGEVIDNVTQISFSISSGTGGSHAVVHFTDVAIEATLDAEVMGEFHTGSCGCGEAPKPRVRETPKSRSSKKSV